MFRVYGRTVEVHHFRVDYTEDEEQRTDYCPTGEEANAIAERTGGTVTELDPGDDAWMDGIEVADVEDTYGEAVRVYEAGEAAWLEAQNQPTDGERLAALESAMLSMMLTGGVSDV